ncbi:hypothetical protein B7494_g2719 [Chlorociboria aeruginascens]|nr:hypothetical protein B7494_g2719 [Chlorociboria aeruginascens]
MTRSNTSSRGHRSSKASSSGDCSQSDNASVKARSTPSISRSVCDFEGCEPSFQRPSDLNGDELSIHGAQQSCPHIILEYKTGMPNKLREHTQRHQTDADTASSPSSPQESIFDVSDCDSGSTINTSMTFDDTSMLIDIRGSYYVPVVLNGVGQWVEDSIYEDTCLAKQTKHDDYGFELDHNLECYNVDSYIRDVLHTFETTFYRTGRGERRSSLALLSLVDNTFTLDHNLSRQRNLEESTTVCPTIEFSYPSLLKPEISPTTSIPPEATPATTELSRDFPKKIWQTSPDGISTETRDRMQTWLSHNPDYRHEILSDGGADAYVAENFEHRPDIVDLYLNLRVPILKADILRYLVLIADGGVYSDIDTTCDGPISSWVPEEYWGKVDLVIGHEFDIDWRGEGSDLASQFTNWAFMSKPGNQHLQIVVDEIVAEFYNITRENKVSISGVKEEMLSDVIDVTGPKRMSRGILRSLSTMLEETIDDRNISNVKEPRLVGDVLILPNAAFAAAQGGYPTDRGPTFVTHHYAEQRQLSKSRQIPTTTGPMGDANIKASSWRLVEVGRVVLIHNGPSQGKLATVVEIIDHKRVLIDGPSTDTKTAVPRQAISLSHLILTPLILEKLPRGARTGIVKAQWEKAGIEAKWQDSVWAKKRLQRERRRALTDFERFKVMRLRKQARFEVRKSLAKVKAAAK